MPKILLVDDEPDLELIAKQKFRAQIEAGVFEVLFAQNGQDALDLMAIHSDIAVVMTDVNMPEMDGFTLIDKLKSINPEIKTIIVSAYGDIKTLRAAMNRGVYDFVTKPVDFRELKDVIFRTLAQHQSSSHPLFNYQLLLAESFPKRVDLSYSHQENALLWDAFLSGPERLSLLGIALVPSPLPMDIGVGVAHGLLKSFVLEDPEASLQDLEMRLSQIHPSLRCHGVLSHYHLDSNSFAYQAMGDFPVHHIRADGKMPLKPFETALLNMGDVITLESPSQRSHLSFSRIL